METPCRVFPFILSGCVGQKLHGESVNVWKSGLHEAGDSIVIFSTLIACVGVTMVKRSHSSALANALADTG